MNPESEHQSNAPEKTAKGPTSEENEACKQVQLRRFNYQGVETAVSTDGLDREILSFYDWAKPQEFENIVRRDLVERLSTVFQTQYAGIEIHTFGSFASGIYLPIADIDLVPLSDKFRRTGMCSFGERKGKINAISDFLESTNIAVPDSIECVAHARVPILKFVDRVTGLRVDLSFDNNSGLIANETSQTWKEQFPIMPA
ncbi:unnamed protein product [Penicillium viridicatum]